MKTAIFLLAAALAAPAAATERYREEAPPPHAAEKRPRAFTELPPGRYTISLSGLLCAVCGRAIAAEWAKLSEIESASVDFEQSSALITVRLDHTLQVALLRKALRRAEKLANLGASYDMRDISYRLVR